MNHLSKLLTIAVFSMFADTMPAQSAKHSGCAKPLAWDTKVLMLTEGASCYELTGKAVSLKLDGHVIQVTGITKDATENARATLTVGRVDNIGEACTQTCTPEPPGDGSRGLTKHERPGAKGGTAGRSDDTQPPQP